MDSFNQRLMKSDFLKEFPSEWKSRDKEEFTPKIPVLKLIFQYKWS